MAHLWVTHEYGRVYVYLFLNALILVTLYIFIIPLELHIKPKIPDEQHLYMDTM